MNKHERMPDLSSPPDFFLGTSFSVEQIKEDANLLLTRVEALGSAHTDGSVVSLKLAAEKAAKLATQIGVLADHLAGVAEKHLARRPRA